jgi:hypothetical protein
VLYRKQPTDDADPIEDDPPGPGAAPPVIMLIGAPQFRDMIEFVASQETLQGKIMLTPGAYIFTAQDEMNSNFHISISTRYGYEHQQKQISAISRRKIQMADLVGVVTHDHYVDAGTRELITYAESEGKEIRYINIRTPDLG